MPEYLERDIRLANNSHILASREAERADLERAVIEAAVNERRCELEAERLEAQRSAADSNEPDFPLLEKIVTADGAAYMARLVLAESVDALIAAREKQ